MAHLFCEIDKCSPFPALYTFFPIILLAEVFWQEYVKWVLDWKRPKQWISRPHLQAPWLGCVCFQFVSPFLTDSSFFSRKRNQNWNKWNFAARKRSQPRFCCWGRWPTRNNISRSYKSIRWAFLFFSQKYLSSFLTFFCGFGGGGRLETISREVTKVSVELFVFYYQKYLSSISI